MSPSKKYKINEIFYSLQGEGARAGTANVFVRFSDCNLRCIRSREGFDCDTEFVSGNEMSLLELLREIKKSSGECRSVILTGGEPALQIDDNLITALKSEGYFIAIETNGTKLLPEGIDWICVSPKTAEHTLKVKSANELKYVRRAGMALPEPSIKAEHYFISPSFDAESLDRSDLQYCIELCQKNPKWRLSVQQHKIWKIR